MAVTRSLLCLLAGLSLFGGALCAQQVPTADEMAFIYELNRARNDPQRYDTENMTTYMGGTYSGVLNGVSPQPPLALNENLVQSARFHSDEMASVGYFAHQSAVNGDYANDMARNAGYPLNSGLPNGTNNIESLAANGTSGSTISYAPNDALRNLLIDAGTSPPGHRIHLLAMNSFNQNFREVGTGYAVGNGWTAGVNAAAYWAIHTGYRNTNPVRMFGVVYDDANANGRYDSGEGLSGVTIDATGPSTLQTTSNARGAWVLDVSAGTWSVTCGGGSFSGTATAGVTVGSDNVEVDFASGRSAGERDFEFQSVGGGPVLTVSANSLVFNAPTAATPSAEQSYDVSGVRLVSNVTITAPSEFQISTTSGSNWTTSLILTPSSGTLATTTIYVRFNPSGASGAIGDVTNTADGALDQLVNVVGTVSTNPAVFASPGTLNLTAARLNAASPEQSYTVSGYNLSGNLDVAATGDFQVSLTSGSGFGSGFSISPSGGTVSPTTVYVRYLPTALGGSSTVTNTSGAQSADVTVNGSVTNSPQITATPGSLTLIAPSMGTPSVEQSFTVSGQYLGGDITVTAPTGFDLTTTSGSNYGSSATLTQSAGVVASTTIYVRYLGGSASANGNVDCTSTLATTQQVAVGGSIAPPPNVSVSSAGLTLNSTGVGTPSPESTYTVSGTNLVGNVTLTTGSGFEISTTSGSGFTTSLSLAPTGGTLAATTVYVRYTPAATGQVIGNVANASAGATTKNVTLWGDVVAGGGGGSSSGGDSGGGGGCTSGHGALPWFLLILALLVPAWYRRRA